MLSSYTQYAWKIVCVRVCLLPAIHQFTCNINEMPPISKLGFLCVCLEIQLFSLP